jgi:hypothetical protein
LVYVDAELDRVLLQPGLGSVLVHNHPASVGLSGPDLGQLSKPGVAAVIAVGHDGSVFAASAGRRMHPEFLESRQYELAKVEVVKRLRAQWPSGSVSVAASDAHLSHLVALAMAKAGIIDYWFVLRGAGRESFDNARVVFNQVVVGAASRLSNVQLTQRGSGGGLLMRIVRYPNDGLDAATLQRSQRVADELLTRARVQPSWAESALAENPDASDPGEVRILLLPARKASTPDVSGEVAEDRRTRLSTILIYMPRLSDLVRTLHTRPDSRSDPRLSTVDLAHVLGLTMAHEIGHILGLDHARSGVMKAAPDMSDLRQLLDSRLMFQPREVARMGLTLQARAVRRPERLQ